MRYYDVIINNYQKGAQLKTACFDKIIRIEQVDSGHHRVIYHLDSAKQKQFIEKVFNRKLRPIGPVE